jgi:hypothetical protein
MKYLLLAMLVSTSVWATDSEDDRVTLETITITGDRKPASGGRSNQ